MNKGQLPIRFLFRELVIPEERLYAVVDATSDKHLAL